MTFPPHFLDELRDRLNIADVVGRHVQLTRRGREFVGRCPFHTEKTPSFTVSADKGFFHCFGCGAHGSVIDFVMRAEGLDFRDAVERLAAVAGLILPASDPRDRERTARRRTLLEANEAACRFFERMLRAPDGRDALAYLRRRGVDDNLIARFRLGFAPGGRGALRAALAADGFADALLTEAGILVVPEDASRAPYDRFRGRVMFPITDRQGRVIAFGGRVLDGGEPKYLNSPETPLFHKGRNLYGLALAAAAARESDSIIVAEGYMDVIGLHRAGFVNVVAPLGTALTEDQIALLWRVAAQPILLFDPDAAGRRAALRAAERVLPMLKAGTALKFAFVETDTGDDPDGVARRYPRQFVDSALAAALSVSDLLFWAETNGRPLRSPEDYAALDARLKQHAARIGDPGVRSHVAASFRERVWQSRRGKMGSMAPPARTASPAVATTMGHDPSAGERRREEILVAVLLTHPEAHDRIGERLGTLSLSTPHLDHLRQAVLSALAANPDLDSGELQSQLRGCGFSDAVESLTGPYMRHLASFVRPESGLEQAISGWEEAYALYRQRDIRAEIEESRRLLAAAPSAETFERIRLLKHRSQSDDDYQLWHDDDHNGG